MLIPNIGFGGAEKSFSKLSMLLAEKHEVYVAVFNKDSYTKESYPHGGTFIDLDVTTGSSVFKKIKAFADRIKKVRALKKEHNIDVTISFLEGADYINILAGTKDRKILSIRGSKTYDRNMTGATGWLRRKILIPYLYSKADVIVSVNKGISGELKKDFGVSSRVRFTEIFNYYDIKAMQQLAAAALPVDLHPLFDRPVLISHGRLSHEKGFQYLLQVFAGVKKQNKETILILVGDGPFRDHLTALCDQYSLSFATTISDNKVPDVFFAGFQSNPLAWLSKATVFTLPSFTEGFPNALVEAMIAGAPVVAADCPWGPRDILDGQPTEGFQLIPAAEYTDNGILLPMLDQPNAVTTWANAITGLLQNNQLRIRMQEQAILRMNSYSYEAISDQWYQLIEQVTQS